MLRRVGRMLEDDVPWPRIASGPEAAVSEGCPGAVVPVEHPRVINSVSGDSGVGIQYKEPRPGGGRGAGQTQPGEITQDRPPNEEVANPLDTPWGTLP